MTNHDFATIIMPLYSDGAKNFGQTSAAILAFSVTFREKVLGVLGDARAAGAMLIAWICYLLTIMFSLAYQWIGPHWIIKLMDDPTNNQGPPYIWGFLSPSLIYGCMVTVFFLGCGFFVLSFFGGSNALVFQRVKSLANDGLLSRKAMLALTIFIFVAALALIALRLASGSLHPQGYSLHQQE